MGAKALATAHRHHGRRHDDFPRPRPHQLAHRLLGERSPGDAVRAHELLERCCRRRQRHGNHCRLGQGVLDEIRL